MADLKDIIAKREELMKAGNTNYTDAMAEARKQVTASQAPTAPTPAPIAPQPIQPAPVAPQVVPPQPIQPAPAPTQPTDWMGDFSQIKKKPFNVNDLPSQLTPEDQAKIDKMQAEWKFWQQSVETQPLQVWQTEFKTVDQTAKAKWIPWEAPVVNRQQEIQNNLATGYQTNPWLFTDRTAFDQAYNYATKSPEEKATLDSFYNSKQPTISSMYSAILNKQEVPDSTKMTPAYKIAQNRYSKASSFSSMTPSQVSDQMRSAKLVEWSQAFEDLKAINPKLVQDATNLRKVNGDTTNIWTTNTDGTKVNNLEKSIADDYTDNFGEFIKTMYKVYTPAEITAIIRTPDVVAAEDKAFAIEKSINEIDKQIANIDKEVDTEFKWSGATGSRLAMEKAARRDNLNKDRDSFVREYTMYANNAKKIIDQNTVSFQTQQQQQKAQNAAMLPFIQDQYKTAQAKKQAEFELNDPATQIKSTMDEFAKLGIVAQGSLPQKIAEANAFIAKGGTLGEYVNKLRSDFMAKPEYKKIQALQQGQLSDAQKMQIGQQYDLQKLAQQNNFDMKKLGIQLQASGWTKDASGNLVNPVTGQVFNGTISSGATGNIVPVSVWNKTVRLDQSGATWFESAIGQLTAAWIPIVVWQGARDQIATIQSMANQYGIPFNASNPAETAQKLRIAGHQVADPGKSNHETGMAIDVYGSSKLDKVTPAQEKILNANGWYSANIPGDAGHFEYRGNWSWSTTGNFSQKAIDLGQNILSGDAKLSDISGKSNEALKVEVMQYIANKNKTTQNTNIAQIQDTIKLIDELKNSGGLDPVVWLKNPFTAWTPWTDAAWFKAKLDQLTAANFMVGIKSMKWLGALSDAEWSKVSASVSSLANTMQSEADYRKELQRLRDVMTNRLISTEKETGIKYDQNWYAINTIDNTTPVNDDPFWIR